MDPNLDNQALLGRHIKSPERATFTQPWATPMDLPLQTPMDMPLQTPMNKPKNPLP